MYEYKPDYEMARKRIDAFWERGVIDRALTYIFYPRPEDECLPEPAKPESFRERWLDPTYRAEKAKWQAHRGIAFADALPVVVAQLGPSAPAAFFGGDLEFDAGTGWATHAWKEWPEGDDAGRIDWESPWFETAFAVMEAIQDAGKGKFITGIQPWLSAADVLSALRTPELFCMDLIERPDDVLAVSDRMAADLLALYDRYYEKARAAGDPATTWLPLVCDGKYHTIQNDVSSLLSPEMFDRFLLPFTRRECDHLDRSMYHLDGLQALKDLDRLLEIPNLDAVQWGPPPQHWDWREWIDVYRRIQEAGKGFFLPIPHTDVGELKDTPLRPEGAWLIVEGTPDRESAEAALKTIEAWT